MKVIILAAGIGSRLGNPLPKCLTPLHAGYSILEHQIENLDDFQKHIMIVVGFKKELIMEHKPGLLYVYNPNFDQTNTSKSLLTALDHTDNEDILWLNGDVVFDKRIIHELLLCPHSSMAVVKTKVGDEEIKFTTNSHGFIDAVSKTVSCGLGEAIGINIIRGKDLPLFKECLRKCADDDYFEKGLELAIKTGLLLYPVDVSQYPCIEVDFPADLAAATHIVHTTLS
jgi:choline kinase